MSDFPFDAVLCDVDGVILHWDPVDELEDRAGLARGSIAGAAFAPHRLRPAITGQITDDEWRALVAEDLAELCGADAAHSVIAEWNAAVPRVDADVVEDLTDARKLVPVVLVSNGTTRLETLLARLGLGGLADAVVNTARIGICKPDVRVYEFAAGRAGVAVERCLFIDDTEGNVEAARNRGMSALHYENRPQLSAALEPLLVDR